MNAKPTAQQQFSTTDIQALSERARAKRFFDEELPRLREQSLRNKPKLGLLPTLRRAGVR